MLSNSTSEKIVSRGGQGDGLGRARSIAVGLRATRVALQLVYVFIIALGNELKSADYCYVKIEHKRLDFYNRLAMNAKKFLL